MGSDIQQPSEQQMFGRIWTSVREQIEQAPGGPKLVAVSILSDSQEFLEVGEKEAARQMINQAKRIIMEYWT